MSDLAGDLEHLDLIVLTFPRFSDGRAYSQARLLRRMGFRGDLRAEGDILRDQLRAMHRAGFDSFAIDDALTAERLARDWRGIIGEFRHAYQPSWRGPEPILRLRHRRAAA